MSHRTRNQSQFMELSGHVEVVVALDGQIGNEWQAAWRDYDWSTNPEADADFRPELRVSDQGTTVTFELGMDGAEGDLSAHNGDRSLQ